jgi:hypothetical protein
LIAAFDPALFSTSERVVHTDWSLLPLLIAPGAVPRTRDVVLSRWVSPHRAVVAVRAPSYLDRAHLRICPASESDDTRAPCTDDEPTWRTAAAPDQPIRHLWPYLDKPVIHAANRRIRFQVPVHTPGADAPHIIRVLDHQRWSIRMVQVSGVEFEGELPSAEIRLPDRHLADGMIEIEAVPGSSAAPYQLGEPPLLEVTVANGALLDPFRDRRVILW